MSGPNESNLVLKIITQLSYVWERKTQREQGEVGTSQFSCESIAYDLSLLCFFGVQVVLFQKEHKTSTNRFVHLLRVCTF